MSEEYKRPGDCPSMGWEHEARLYHRERHNLQILLDRRDKELPTLKAEIARVKESWDKTARENTSLIQKKGELEEENERLEEKHAELVKRFSCEHGVLFSNDTAYDCSQCEKEDKTLFSAVKKAGGKE